jgi:glycosyltransferase involved in cell wall biosynthesis
MADVSQFGLREEFRRDAARATGAGRPPRIIFNGFVSAWTGFGTAARSYVHAFHRAGIELSVVDRSPVRNEQMSDPVIEGLLGRPIDAEFCVCHVEPLDLVTARTDLPPIVALTAWETDTLPAEYVERLNQAREVWIPSYYNLEVFRRQLSTSVFRLPHAVHVPPGATTEVEEIDEELGLGKKDFVFLTIATWQERKNLTGTIEAFLRAFPGEPDVKLVIKTGFYFVPKEKVRLQVARRIWGSGLSLTRQDVETRIKIFQAGWTEERMMALQQRADCYVSLHSGEGWCYPLFDSACAGRPVIATGYAGPMDYLDPQSHNLVRYELTRAKHGEDPDYFRFSSDMVWASPDILHAAQLMRSVYENYRQAQERAAAGAVRLRQAYSLEAVGSMARERLEQLGLSS